jgi:uncharacterized protein
MKRYLYVLPLFITVTSLSQVIPSNTKLYVFRLAPHEDVKKSIIDFAVKNEIKAGCIVSAVGSLEQVNLRFANQEKGTLANGHFEIVSLTGTFSDISSHLHISVSDETGRTIGGHLLNDNLIFTTLEIVVSDLRDLEFAREKDKTYGYSELVVRPRTKN